MADTGDKHKLVQDAYGAIATRELAARQGGSCCGPQAACCGSPATVAAAGPASALAAEADLGLSCGDPVAFSRILPGMTVLDLGSGAGRDAFIAAPLVGAAGLVIGVDMTPEMLRLARANALRFANQTGLANMEFRQGYIERLPVADASVDLVISNCVINLSPDKAQVFREAFRVLKPGGELVVSDVVLRKPLPPEVLDDARLYAACIAGALPKEEYLAAVTAAGFVRLEVLSETVYMAEQACDDPVTSPIAGQLAGAAASITLLARKP